MNCPNCSRPAPETDQECSHCGFILSKWRAAQAAAGSASPGDRPSSAPPVPAATQAPDPGFPLDTVLLFGLFVALAGYYWLGPRGTGEVSAESRPLGPNACAFSGEVLDIYRLAPVEGVRVSFTPKAAAVTDPIGNYFVKVKTGVRYSVTLTHPGFKAGYIEGFTRDWREAPFDQRVNAARSASGTVSQEAKDADFECEQGQERVFNFALVPASVTAEEQARIDEAVRPQ